MAPLHYSSFALSLTLLALLGLTRAAAPGDRILAHIGTPTAARRALAGGRDSCRQEPTVVYSKPEAADSTDDSGYKRPLNPIGLAALCFVGMVPLTTGGVCESVVSGPRRSRFLDLCQFLC